MNGDGTEVKLTEAQQRVLANIAAGRNPYDGFHNGRQARGGITGPVAILSRRGLIFGLEITPAGRLALSREGK